MLGSSTALAAPTVSDCVAGDAPDRFLAAACSLGGSPVCVWDGVTKEMRCDISANCSSAAEMILVRDGSFDFNAWGTCGSTAFCCEIDDGAKEILTIGIESGSAADTLSLQYPVPTLGVAVPSPTHELRPLSGATELTGVAVGNELGDRIFGSTSSFIDVGQADYTEILYGEGGADLIFGFAGQLDILDGGPGGDWLNGGPGADTIRGDEGPDKIVGGADDDLIRGFDGDDILCGDLGAPFAPTGGGSWTLVCDQDSGAAAGIDAIYGGQGEDSIVGGGGEDYIEGGNDNDVICAEKGTAIGDLGDDSLYGNGFTALDGGGGTDACYDGATTDPSCESTPSGTCPL